MFFRHLNNSHTPNSLDSKITPSKKSASSSRDAFRRIILFPPLRPQSWLHVLCFAFPRPKLTDKATGPALNVRCMAESWGLFHPIKFADLLRSTADIRLGTRENCPLGNSRLEGGAQQFPALCLPSFLAFKIPFSLFFFNPNYLGRLFVRISRELSWYDFLNWWRSWHLRESRIRADFSADIAKLTTRANEQSFPHFLFGLLCYPEAHR